MQTLFCANTDVSVPLTVFSIFSKTLLTKLFDKERAMRFQTILFSLLFSIPGYSFFADDISIGTPSVAGSGCPAGTADISFSPNSASGLKINLDGFIVEAGGFTGRTISRKGCNLAFPVHVPQGFSVSMTNPTIPGYAYLSKGSYARISTSYFFAGARGPSNTKILKGSYNDDFKIRPSYSVGAMSWSRCGADVTIRVKISAMLRAKSRNQDAFLVIDSFKVPALQFRRCR